MFISTTVGELTIERVCTGLGGRVVAVAVLTHVEQFFARPEWVYRRAAVAAVARLAEGCAALFLKSYFDISLQFLSRAIVDASPIVRFEAMQVSPLHS